MAQETLGRPLLPGSRRPFAPSRKHFSGFPFFGHFQRSASSQGQITHLICVRLKKRNCKTTFFLGGGGEGFWLFYASSVFLSCNYTYFGYSVCNLRRERPKTSANAISETRKGPGTHFQLELLCQEQRIATQFLYF